MTGGDFLEAFPFGVNTYGWFPFHAHATPTSGPVIADGIAYFADEEANIYAVDVSSGELLWEHQIDTPSAPVLTVADGVIYVAADTTIYALGSE